MAGLLDALQSDDGLLGLALLSAGAAKPVRTSLGEGLLGGMQLVQQNRNAREERAQRMRMQQMQEQQLRMALEDRQRQQQQAQDRSRYLSRLDPNQGPPMEATPAGAMAAGLSPKEFGMLAPRSADPMAGIDKVSPKDYTPDSWTQFVRTRDPAVLRAAPKDDKPPADWQLYQLSGAAQRGMSFDAWDQARRRAGATSVSVNTADRIPPTLVKQQDDLIDKMTTARAIDADLGSMQTKIESGTLKFGPVRNVVNTTKNIAGMSDEESRAFGTFKSTLEKLRNDSLRLNTGVQTEGDAQRAWNELFQNINDTEFVKQRLAEIRNINQRAAQLHEYRLNTLRQNSGANPLPAPQINPAIPPGEAQKVRRFNPQTGKIEEK